MLLESADGRPHLEQARPVILAGKPLFIDKPLTGSLRDAIEIFRLAREHDVPIFSSSSYRFYERRAEVNRADVLVQRLHLASWSGAGSFHRPQILIQPSKGFLNDLFSWHAVTRVEDFVALMFRWSAQQTKRVTLGCFNGEEKVVTTVQH